MDTKWKKSRPAVSFFCFVLGVSLLVLSGLLAGYGAAHDYWGSALDALKRDYQDTAAFQTQITDQLQSLRQTAQRGDWDETHFFDGKNLLYQVCRDGKVLFSNTHELSPSGALPEGFNFRLYFDGEKVTVEKDGEALDIYGDGYYRPEENDWFVPGYHNLTAEDTLYGYGNHASTQAAATPTPSTDRSAAGRVTVCIAAAREPVYWDAGYDPLYQLVEGLYRARTALSLLAIFPIAGLICLAVYVVRRRDKALADQAIASVTGRIWLELKLLLLIPLGLSIFGAFFLCFSFVFFGLERPLSTYLLLPPAALWGSYLVVNDLRYNGRRCFTHNFCSACVQLFRTGELRYPVQRRLARRAVWQFVSALPFIIAAALFAALTLFGGYFYYYSGLTVLLFLCCLGGVALIAVQVLLLRRSKQSAADLGVLLDRIDAVHAGALDQASSLPEDSDLRQAAEALGDIESGIRSALEEQTRSERMKVELIANVSHDLKTPLTSIISYAELLSQESGLPRHVQDYIRILNEKAERLKIMVQEVFEVSKAASGNLPVHLETLDLAKLLRQTMADMAEAIEASRLTFRPQLPDQPVLIQADGDRLYRVFQNLIQNALQYSLDGSRVYLSLSVQENSAVVRVQNTSKDELPDGIDFTARFVRGDESRTDGGSGLGLSIARTFTEACGGAFRVEVVADLFAAVVTFPLSKVSAQEKQS